MNALATAILYPASHASMEEAGALYQKPLILVAHPDDEAIACGVLLQRAQQPLIVFATDGAPRADFFWQAYGSRSAYAATRRAEAFEAHAGVRPVIFLSDHESEKFVDQELYLSLSSAAEWLSAVVETAKPTALLTHAYEGGHPDHDACSFLASMLSEEFALPVWEMPLYHAAYGVSMQLQEFLQTSTDEFLIAPRNSERREKCAMLAAYRSQREVLRLFDLAPERFRRQPAYNFLQPPHGGRVNYENWGWPIRAADLCRAFAQYLEALRTQTALPLSA